MRFCGWDFGGTDYPINLTVTPPGNAWPLTPLTMVADRTQAATKGTWRVKPVGMTWANRPRELPDLSLTQVVTAMVAAEPAAGGGAADLGNLLNQRGDLLEYHGMGNVMCAASAMAVFRYPITDRLVYSDALLVVAYNLSQARDGRNVRSIVLHTRDQNSEQVHAEQICYAQIQAFLALLNSRRQAARVGGGHADTYRNLRFDFGRLDVDINVTFAHAQNNVDADCAGCRATKIELTAAWGPETVQPVRRGQQAQPVIANNHRCHSFEVTVAREL